MPAWAAALLAIVLTTACTAQSAPTEPLVVLDTDLGPDIDDALALAMVHRLADEAVIELAAITISRTSDQAVRYARSINTIEGRPDLPVGVDPRSPYLFDESASYVSLVDNAPSRIGDTAVDGMAADDGAVVLRRVLARAIDEERPVVVIQIGFSGNLSALLDSGPDDVSPLSGTELVEASGATLSIMAGTLVEPLPGFSATEFNVVQDVAAAKRVLSGWPGELVLSPFELGHDVLFPYAAIRDGLAPDHWVRQAYEYNDLSWHVDAPPFYDMRAWDLTSVLVGAEPERGHFPVSEPGTVSVDDQGRTTFVAGPGRHRYLDSGRLDPAAEAVAIDRMIELVVGGPIAERS